MNGEYSNEKNNESRELEETSYDTQRSIYLSKFSGRNHYKGRNLSDADIETHIIYLGRRMLYEYIFILQS